MKADHVRQACDLFDAGSAVPKRPARSTFLHFNGKTYPAKFIRGLAYRIATGIELHSTKDFTGGDETTRFFSSLGFEAPSSSLPTPALPTVSATPTPVVGVVAEPTERKYEPQKRALLDLLKKRFGTVECEAQFSWLVVPKSDGLIGPLAAISQALQEMRGFLNFAGAGRLLRCDFYIPRERLIVEYDERQHFTLQRARALELYPPDLPLEFSRDEWIRACETIKATDFTPPHRDEQRAFYDALRDILAHQNGYRLVRIRQREFDWTTKDAADRLEMTISAASKSVQNTAVQVSAEIKKIALVAHDYTVSDSRGLHDYSEHFTRINKLCDDQHCDTVLYALYTWDTNSPVPRTHESIFADLKNVQRIVVEVGQPPNKYDHVEIWLRGRREPILAHQRFAQSTASTADKRRFLSDLPSRQIDAGLLMICGESNIVQLKRATKSFEDWFKFCDRVQELNTEVILNPIHDYMTRYEMRLKRKFYSRNGRTVVSVWNKGKGKESWLPWTVFHDGEERTDRVQTLGKPFSERPDIMIGVVDLKTIGLLPQA